MKEKNIFVIDGREAEMPSFETEKAAEAWEALSSLTKEEREDLLRNAAKEMKRMITEEEIGKALGDMGEISFSDEDMDEYLSVMTETVAAGTIGPKDIAKAWRAANRTIIGTIQGLDDMKAFLERFRLWKNDTIVITGFDTDHRLVYMGRIKSDPSVLSFRLKSIAEIYRDTVSSMIFIMNDPDLYDRMNRKLAKGLLRRLGLALKSVGYGTTDILCSDGRDLISLRQFSS